MKLRASTLLIAAVLSLPLGISAHAQRYPTLVSQDELNELLKQYQDNPVANLPSGTTAVAVESGRLDLKIAEISNNLSYLTQIHMLTDAGKLKSDLITSLNAIKTLDCTRDSDKFRIEAARVNVVLDKTADAIQKYTLSVDLSPADVLPNTKRIEDINTDLARACQSTQSLLDESTVTEIGKLIDSTAAELKEQADKITEYKSTASKLLPILKQRQSALVEKLNASSPSAQVGTYLWLIVLVLGLSGILTMLVVWLFDTSIQMEWVSSGQVIQFVTVMILLSVIMVLGLSNILKEETLGTLLGGIAGYVLAQGVGRAAAQAVAKSGSIRAGTGGGPSGGPSGGAGAAAAGSGGSGP